MSNEIIFDMSNKAQSESFMKAMKDLMNLDGERVNIVDETETVSDMVNHPPHYQSASGLEVIDVIDAFVDGIVGREASYKANAIKYILRYNSKNGAEDLKKAIWYINRIIDIYEKECK